MPRIYVEFAGLKQAGTTPETDFIQHPRKGTNENALFCFRAMAAEKGVFHREKSLSDVREKATPPDAGLHSCTGGVFAVPLRGGPFQDSQRWER